ncbi:MAG: 4Fe-4S cluster-binding domain-containing protein, partial [Myxococcota bacterium]
MNSEDSAMVSEPDVVGFIHSIETAGAVDGPGLRYVVFLQGCHLRCQYCHNPDTWTLDGGEQISADRLSANIGKYRDFLVKYGGGVTLSGGEPLIQHEIVLNER